MFYLEILVSSFDFIVCVMLYFNDKKHLVKRVTIHGECIL